MRNVFKDVKVVTYRDVPLFYFLPTIMYTRVLPYHELSIVWFSLMIAFQWPNHRKRRRQEEALKRMMRLTEEANLYE